MSLNLSEILSLTLFSTFCFIVSILFFPRVLSSIPNSALYLCKCCSLSTLSSTISDTSNTSFKVFLYESSNDFLAIVFIALSFKPLAFKLLKLSSFSLLPLVYKSIIFVSASLASLIFAILFSYSSCIFSPGFIILFVLSIAIFFTPPTAAPAVALIIPLPWLRRSVIAERAEENLAFIPFLGFFTPLFPPPTKTVAKLVAPNSSKPATPIKGRDVAIFNALESLESCIVYKSFTKLLLSFFLFSLVSLTTLSKSEDNDVSLSALPLGTYWPVAVFIFLVPSQVLPNAFFPKFPIPRACACNCLFLSLPPFNTEFFKSLPNWIVPLAKALADLPTSPATNNPPKISFLGSEFTIVSNVLEPVLSPTIPNILVNILVALNIKFITRSAIIIPAIDSFVNWSTTVTKHVYIKACTLCINTSNVKSFIHLTNGFAFPVLTFDIA